MNLTFVTFPMLPVRPSWRTRPTSRIIIAHAMVRDALVAGTLAKQPCCICGQPKADAHHEDYQRPNWIAWLCNIHHRRRHWELGWGTRNGNNDHYIGNTPFFVNLAWPSRFGEFSRWDAATQKTAIANKEVELLWLLEHYGCVKLCGSGCTPKVLKEIFQSAIQKFNLVSFTLDEFERIESTRRRLHYDTRPPMYRDAILAFIEADEASHGKILPLSPSPPASLSEALRAGPSPQVPPSSIAAETPNSPPVSEPRRPVTYTKPKRPW